MTKSVNSPIQPKPVEVQAPRQVKQKPVAYVGKHTIKIGNGPKVNLDNADTERIRFMGFSKATRQQSEFDWMTRMSNGALAALTRQRGSFDVGMLLRKLNTFRAYYGKLVSTMDEKVNFGEVSVASMAPAVQKMSNAALTAVHGTFCSKEMTQLKEALEYEARTNPEMREACMANLETLMNLEALVISEISKRYSASVIMQESQAANARAVLLGQELREATTQAAQLRKVASQTLDPEEKAALEAEATELERTAATLTGSLQEAKQKAVRGHIVTISEAHQSKVSSRPADTTQYIERSSEFNPFEEREGYRNLDTSAREMGAVVETQARSAVAADKAEAEINAKIAKRGLDGASMRAIGDNLREHELTINIAPQVLFGDAGNDEVLDDPKQFPVDDKNFRLKNAFELGGKSKGYMDTRRTAEEQQFPALKGTNDAHDRPIYGALNVSGRKDGAASAAYGGVVVVLKPHVKQAATYTFGDTLETPRLVFSPDKEEAFIDALMERADILSFNCIEDLQDANSTLRQKIHQAFSQNKQLNLNEIDNFLLNDMRIELGFEPGARADVDDCNHLFRACALRACGIQDENAQIPVSFDNLEMLLPRMGNPMQVRLAMAATSSTDRDVQVEGAQYIEAQLHQPIEFWRDVAEIRLGKEDLSRDLKKREKIAAAIREWGELHGIKVTFFEDMEVQGGLVGDRKAQKEKATREKEQHEKVLHVLCFEKRDAIVDFADKTASENVSLAEQFLNEQEDSAVLRKILDASGVPLLDGDFRKDLEQRQYEKLLDVFGSKEDFDPFDECGPEDLCKEILQDKLGKKFAMLRALASDSGKYHFDTPEQKAAFVRMIMQAKDISTVKQMEHLYTASRMLEGIFVDVMDEKITEEEFPARMMSFFNKYISQLDESLKETGKSATMDFLETSMTQCISIAMTFFQTGNDGDLRPDEKLGAMKDMLQSKTFQKFFKALYAMQEFAMVEIFSSSHRKDPEWKEVRNILGDDVILSQWQGEALEEFEQINSMEAPRPGSITAAQKRAAHLKRLEYMQTIERNPLALEQGRMSQFFQFVLAITEKFEGEMSQDSQDTQYKDVVGIGRQMVAEFFPRLGEVADRLVPCDPAVNAECFMEEKGEAIIAGTLASNPNREKLQKFLENPAMANALHGVLMEVLVNKKDGVQEFKPDSAIDLTARVARFFGDVMGKIDGPPTDVVNAWRNRGADDGAGLRRGLLRVLYTMMDAVQNYTGKEFKNLSDAEMRALINHALTLILTYIDGIQDEGIKASLQEAFSSKEFSHLMSAVDLFDELSLGKGEGMKRLTPEQREHVEERMGTPQWQEEAGRLHFCQAFFEELQGALKEKFNLDVTPKKYNKLLEFGGPARDAFREMIPTIAKEADDFMPLRPLGHVAKINGQQPSTFADNHAFLQNCLPFYRHHETSFDAADSHGRSHATRVFVFATVLGNILKEKGIPVDVGAAAQMAAIHDIGREAMGEDIFEEKSALIGAYLLAPTISENAFKNFVAYLASRGVTVRVDVLQRLASGEEIEAPIVLYEGVTKEELTKIFLEQIPADAGVDSEVRYLLGICSGITSNQANPLTVEGYLLHSSDSLDFTRIRPIDLRFFPFLRGMIATDGKILDEDAEKLREELVKEATQLTYDTHPTAKCSYFYVYTEEGQAILNSRFEEYDEASKAAQKTHDAKLAQTDEQMIEYVEKAFLDHPDQFPLLNKYYHP